VASRVGRGELSSAHVTHVGRTPHPALALVPPLSHTLDGTRLATPLTAVTEAVTEELAVWLGDTEELAVPDGLTEPLAVREAVTLPLTLKLCTGRGKHRSGVKKYRGIDGKRQLMPNP